MTSRTDAFRRKSYAITGYYYVVNHIKPTNPVEQKSSIIGRLARRLGFVNSVGEAVSNSGLSFLGGATRNPKLKVGTGSDYSHVREVSKYYGYTWISVERKYCFDCRRPTLERHTMELRSPQGTPTKIGYVEACSICDKDMWLFTGHMPKVVAARKRQTKVVT